jgi:membrane protein YdbS with pleckstrin-like domain
MEKLHPKSVWLFFFRFLLSGIFLWVFLFFFLFSPLVAIFGRNFFSSFLALLVIFLAYCLFCRLWAGLSYNAYKCELTEDVFKKEHGVIWKRYVSIPYERIQNVDIHRGVIARILGLSSLMIQTAGYSGHNRSFVLGAGDPEGKLPGLSREKAEELREDLIRKTKGSKSGL